MGGFFTPKEHIRQDHWIWGREDRLYLLQTNQSGKRSGTADRKRICAGTGKLCRFIPGNGACRDGSTAHTRYCINAMENEINTTRYSCLQKHIFWQK